MADLRTRETATSTPAPIDPLRVLRFMVALATAQVVCVVVGTLCGWPWWLRLGFSLAVSASWWRVSLWVLRGGR